MMRTYTSKAAVIRAEAPVRLSIGPLGIDGVEWT